MRSRFELLVLEALVLAAPILIAQTPGADQPPVIKSTTRAVVVDVVVMNGKGDAITGLGKDQFQIIEDGKPQAVDFFEEHVARTRAEGSLPSVAKMPPGVYTNVPPAPVDDAVNLLLLDSLNTPPQLTSYARKEILGYLNNVKPGTRLAIITLGDKLNFVQGFTTDAARLRTVATSKATPGISPSLITGNEVASEQETEGFLSSESAAGSNPSGTSGGSTGGGNGTSGSGWSNPTVPITSTATVANAFANYQQFKQANRIRMTLEALSDIARYLASVPGRKNLIWFAGEFPVAVFPKFDQKMEFENNVISLKDVQKTADLLTAARVAVYPVYANGMMTDSIVTADNRSPGSAANPSRMSSMSNMDNYIDSSSDRAGAIASMNQLASDTGGKAIYNTNDLDTAIGRSVADGSHYYTLSYSPANKKMDGHYRKIEVKLADSKAKLSYRHGYNADEDAVAAADSKKDADRLRQQLIHGTPDATQILFAAHIAPATPQPVAGAKHAGRNPELSGPSTRYSIDFMIRWTDVAFTEAADGTHQGKIEAGLIAWDSKGKAVNWTEGTQQMALKPEIYTAIQKSGIPAHMEIDLPNTEVFLKVGIFDPGTGKSGTLEIPLHPAGETTAGSPQAPAIH